MVRSDFNVDNLIIFWVKAYEYSEDSPNLANGVFKGPITFADGSVVPYNHDLGSKVASYADYNENHQYPGNLFKEGKHE